MRGARDQSESGGRARSWPAPARAELLAIAGVTGLALVLRAIALGDGMYGDELITVDDTRSDLAGVFDGLERNEINPPLFYLLAWGAKHLGDAVSLLRLPSVVLGTAVVPVVWGLGRRLAGPRVGLLAAGLVALSPFAIFYATEARAYASVMFFVALSSFALLRAVESERNTLWWVVYGVATLCAIYTHYTSIYVVLGLVAWAAVVHRDRVRRLAVVLALVALAYLPWVPALLEQRENDLFVAIVGLGFKLTPNSVFESLGRLVGGHPFVPLAAVPGRAWLVALAATAASIAALGLGRKLRAPDVNAARAEVAFVAILAFATPVGLLAYTLISSDLYVPRNLTVARSSTSRTRARCTATATRCPSPPTPRCSTTSSSWPP